MGWKQDQGGNGSKLGWGEGDKACKREKWNKVGRRRRTGGGENSSEERKENKE